MQKYLAIKFIAPAAIILAAGSTAAYQGVVQPNRTYGTNAPTATEQQAVIDALNQPAPAAQDMPQPTQTAADSAPAPQTADTATTTAAPSTPPVIAQPKPAPGVCMYHDEYYTTTWQAPCGSNNLPVNNPAPAPAAAPAPADPAPAPADNTTPPLPGTGSGQAQ